MHNPLESLMDYDIFKVTVVVAIPNYGGETIDATSCVVLDPDCLLLGVQDEALTIYPKPDSPF